MWYVHEGYAISAFVKDCCPCRIDVMSERKNLRAHLHIQIFKYCHAAMHVGFLKAYRVRFATGLRPEAQRIFE